MQTSVTPHQVCDEDNVTSASDVIECCATRNYVRSSLSWKRRIRFAISEQFEHCVTARKPRAPAARTAQRAADVTHECHARHQLDRKHPNVAVGASDGATRDACAVDARIQQQRQQGRIDAREVQVLQRQRQEEGRCARSRQACRKCSAQRWRRRERTC